MDFDDISPVFVVFIVVAIVVIAIVVMKLKKKNRVSSAYPYPPSRGAVVQSTGMVLAPASYPPRVDNNRLPRASFTKMWPGNALPAPPANVFGKLLQMTTELDSDVFSLRQALCAVAPMITDWPDAASLTAIETLCDASFRTDKVFSTAELNTAASKLELKLASCQLLCALIDPGPIEEGDRSLEDYSYLSLLAKGESQIVSFSGKTQEKRQIVEAAKNDLAAARKWMEAATIVLRALPASARFADMRAAR